MMTPKMFWLLVGIVIGACVVLALSCAPTNIPIPVPTTASTTSTTTIPAGGTPVGSASELQSVVSSGGHALVNGTIVSYSTITPAQGSTISFSGSGKLMRPESATGPAIDIAASDVTLNNARIEGTDECVWTNTLAYNPDSIGEKYAAYDPPREHDHGIEISPGGDRVKINNPTISKVWGDAIYFNGGKNAQITNPQIRCAGRGGIVAVNVDGLTVNGGNVSGTFWWAINLEPYGGYSINNVAMRNLVVGFSRWQWLQAGNGEGANCQITSVDLSQVVRLPQSTRPSTVQWCVRTQVVE